MKKTGELIICLLVFICNLLGFAEQAKPHDHSFSPRPGVTLGERFVPMERVGCYIPGGTAPLVSTVIHTVAIAKAAGVREIVATTPVMEPVTSKAPPTLLTKAFHCMVPTVL